MLRATIGFASRTLGLMLMVSGLASIALGGIIETEVPEIDPASATSAIALLVGAALMCATSFDYGKSFAFRPISTTAGKSVRPLAGRRRVSGDSVLVPLVRCRRSCLTTSSNSPQPAVGAGPWLVVRTAVLLGVLSVEVLSFSLCFDVQPLQQSDFFLARIAGHGTAIFRVVVGTVVALLLIGRSRLPAVFGRWSELALRDRSWSWMLVVHLISAGWFAVLSSSMLAAG